jgi:predicted Rossmann-fold nucleotide-binding protein
MSNRGGTVKKSFTVFAFALMSLGWTPVSRAAWNNDRVRARHIPKRTRVLGRKVEHLDPLAKYRAQGKAVIAVLGSADSGIPTSVLRKAHTLGRQIGKRGYVLVTGACPGAPDAAVEGAKEVGGITGGFSSYGSKRAHERSGNPVDNFDVLQLSSLPPGLRRIAKGDPNHMGRELTMIARADAVIIVRGRSGTLSEFAMAMEAKKPIGILGKTGGVAEGLIGIMKRSTRAGKPPAAALVYDSSPKRLLNRLAMDIESSRADGHRGSLGDGDMK